MALPMLELSGLATGLWHCGIGPISRNVTSRAQRLLWVLRARRTRRRPRLRQSRQEHQPRKRRVRTTRATINTSGPTPSSDANTPGPGWVAVPSGVRRRNGSTHHARVRRLLGDLVLGHEVGSWRWGVRHCRPVAMPARSRCCVSREGAPLRAAHQPFPLAFGLWLFKELLFRALILNHPSVKICLRRAQNRAPLAQQTQQPNLRPQTPSNDSNKTRTIYRAEIPGVAGRLGVPAKGIDFGLGELYFARSAKVV